LIKIATNQIGANAFAKVLKYKKKKGDK